MRMLHGQTRYNVPSRFIDELPATLLQWLSAKPRNFLDTPIASEAIPRSNWSANSHSLPRDHGGFRVGQQVRHAKFGTGVIIGAEGSGKNTQVEVNFVDFGIKRLALEFAKLEAA
ncbi:MAG: hypothetical protein EAZ24_09515 [Burkholderiales bacterium]|nr:MAG: hypothetical protein EAZ24_09515 [Burkholderiales bacterium]